MTTASKASHFPKALFTAVLGSSGMIGLAASAVHTADCIQVDRRTLLCLGGSLLLQLYMDPYHLSVVHCASSPAGRLEEN